MLEFSYRLVYVKHRAWNTKLNTKQKQNLEENSRISLHRWAVRRLLSVSLNPASLLTCVTAGKCSPRQLRPMTRSYLFRGLNPVILVSRPIAVHATRSRSVGRGSQRMILGRCPVEVVEVTDSALVPPPSARFNYDGPSTLSGIREKVPLASRDASTFVSFRVRNANVLSRPRKKPCYC